MRFAANLIWSVLVLVYSHLEVLQTTVNDILRTHSVPSSMPNKSSFLSGRSHKSGRGYRQWQIQGAQIRPWPHPVWLYRICPPFQRRNIGLREILGNILNWPPRQMSVSVPPTQCLDPLVVIDCSVINNICISEPLHLNQRHLSQVWQLRNVFRAQKTSLACYHLKD